MDLMKVELVVICIFLIITLFELVRAVIWEIQDDINDYIRERKKNNVYREDRKRTGTRR